MGGEADVQMERGPWTVLVVDDSPDIRELAQGALDASEDFVVVGAAGDGRAAVTATADLRPDVVLLNLRMPRMDGLEALDQLRVTAPATRVVVFSAFERLAPEAMRRGAIGFLDKSFGEQPLPTRLRACLEAS